MWKPFFVHTKLGYGFLPFFYSLEGSCLFNCHTALIITMFVSYKEMVFITYLINFFITDCRQQPDKEKSPGCKGSNF